MHLKDLLKQSEGMDFRINWVNISMDDLQDRRTPNECIGYVKVIIKFRNFSKNELGFLNVF